jgi:hypothetical protein
MIADSRRVSSHDVQRHSTAQTLQIAMLIICLHRLWCHPACWGWKPCGEAAAEKGLISLVRNFHIFRGNVRAATEDFAATEV